MDKIISIVPQPFLFLVLAFFFDFLNPLLHSPVSKYIQRIFNLNIRRKPKGENAILIAKFWVNSHFVPKIDFVTNIIFKERKLFLKWSLLSTNQQKNPTCLTDLHL